MVKDTKIGQSAAKLLLQEEKSVQRLTPNQGVEPSGSKWYPLLMGDEDIVWPQYESMSG